MMSSERIRLVFRTVLVACLLAVVPSLAAGAEGERSGPRKIRATSCSQADVQKAITAAQDGAIVLVPAGTATWRTVVPRQAAVVISSRAITLQGAGVDKTVIVDGTGKLTGEIPLAVNQVEGKPVRITGFTFKGMKKRSRAEAALSIRGNCWRVDHCKFDPTSGEGRGMWARGRGVVDNCVFVNCKQGVAVMGDGEASWARKLALGTADAVYVEDCTFNCARPEDGAMDAYNGARYVFRHNTVIGVNMGHHGCDSGNYRSTFSFEIYDNTMDGRHMPSQGRAIHLRGGTGVIFDNTLVNYKTGIGLSNYRSFRPCGKWGMCDGKNPIDGNEEPNGYPSRDQIGRSTNQILESLYMWNNTLDGGEVSVGVNDAGKGIIKEGRDYFTNTPRPGYKPYTYPHPFSQ